MRLINTTTLELHEFIDAQNAPPYAILSHRWGQQEVSYEDYQAGRERDGSGYRKVVDCCDFARHCGQDWLWVDTCCIDKRSSADLSEAINSMFSWYQNALWCFLHLADVTAPFEDEDRLWMQFRRSEWFTRGWTLQELIAPGLMTFVTNDWRTIGWKLPDLNADRLPSVSRDTNPSRTSPAIRKIMSCGAGDLGATLNPIIKQITGVPRGVLASAHSPHGYSVAERLKWAADRTTTPAEDIAYCLLGLLGINMPLLYGEGSMAFTRLQTEFIGRYEDDSILAWTRRYTSVLSDFATGSDGILAESPHDFKNNGMSIRVNIHNLFHRRPYTVTNRGLHIQIPERMRPGVYRHMGDYRRLMLALNCVYTHALDSHCVIYLVQDDCGHYSRQQPQVLDIEGHVTEFQSGWAPLDEEDVLYVHISSPRRLGTAGVSICPARAPVQANMRNRLHYPPEAWAT